MRVVGRGIQRPVGDAWIPGFSDTVKAVREQAVQKAITPSNTEEGINALRYLDAYQYQLEKVDPEWDPDQTRAEIAAKTKDKAVREFILNEDRRMNDLHGLSLIAAETLDVALGKEIIDELAGKNEWFHLEPALTSAKSEEIKQHAKNTIASLDKRKVDEIIDGDAIWKSLDLETITCFHPNPEIGLHILKQFEEEKNLVAVADILDLAKKYPVDRQIVREAERLKEIFDAILKGHRLG